MDRNNLTVAVIGLGYVGLPLAVEFGKRYRTIGLELSQAKVDAYNSHVDPTGEVSVDDLIEAVQDGGLEATTDASLLATADFLIIAVPTPVTAAHTPDFAPLISASMVVGKNMKMGATIIYESTVYPGATEEVCIPILEMQSGMRWKHDFHVGYSPERINPGDKEHTLTQVVKIVSGDGPETLDAVAALYGNIIKAGIHKASSIKVAEAAKVIENTQRDLNIALMNELAIIFDKIGIDTTDVLAAAGTKWNFVRFKPGLVGGHCIGVDPYYLTYKAETLGYHPQVILAGRRINDGMGKFIAEKTVKLLIQSGTPIFGARVIVLGLTFKEDCSDIRNSRVPDLIIELRNFGIDVHVHDPLAIKDDVQREYGVILENLDELPRAEALIVAVAHKEFCSLPQQKLLGYVSRPGVVVDVKSILNPTTIKEKGITYWRL